MSAEGMHKPPSAAIAAQNELHQQQQRQEKLLLPLPTSAMRKTSKRAYLEEVKQIDFHFRLVGAGVVTLWLTLIAVSYTFAPEDCFEVLEGPELHAALFSASFLGFNLIVRFFKILWLDAYNNNNKSPTKMSGVLWASFAVQSVACLTNSLMAIGIPIPVMIDPVLKTRVFLLRWCEWTPLSYCMTFLVCGVDPATGLGYGYMIGASQSLSTICGLALPFCKTAFSWWVVMTISCVLWGGIFVAYFHQKKSFSQMEKGSSAHSIELFERAQLSFRLVTTCSIAWSTLVLMYFFAGAAAYLRPEGVPDHELPLIQRKSFEMIWECLMDVILKNLYMDIIVKVHKVAFDDSERASRRIAELREQMSAIWESSSDPICVSVQGISGAVTTMVSPVYLREFHGMSQTKAIVFEMDEKDIRSKDYSKLKARAVRENNFPVLSITSSKIIHKVDTEKFDLANLEHELDESLLTSLAGMVGRGWNHNSGNSHMTHRLLKVSDDGKKVFAKCEANICKLENDAMLMVIRDISERTKRFEAEKKTILETTARKKDAEANRFTRHEVKNGLLAAIDLCESLKESALLPDFTQMGDEHHVTHLDATTCGLPTGELDTNKIPEQEQIFNQNVSMYTKELDKTLKRILDTILSEAMARDVIHGNYEPKLERVDLDRLLHTSEMMHDQFQLKVSPSPMPSLHLDPQLLVYIHRNAVSNACKYGKVNGPVTTKVTYDEVNQLLQMDVVNLPGPGHERLLELGASAASQVFAPGKRLHNNESHRSPTSHSAGDGAWIMQKCAETLRGKVNIHFEADKTVFTLVCPAKRFEMNFKPEHFQIPKNTWGVAIDDSKIQRKLLARFLSHAGIAESRQFVNGRTKEEIQCFDSFLVDLVQRNPNDYFLVVVDENLDITENGTLKTTVSGSECIQRVRQRLEPHSEARMLGLVRSANDSSEDVAMYLSRAHGFVPKAPVRSTSVVEAIAPLWEQRFNNVRTTVNSSTLAMEPDMGSGDPGMSDFLSLVVSELQSNLDAVDELCSEESDSSLKENWPFVWEKLHCLKGDLSSLFNTPSIEQAVADVNAMRGPELPVDFDVRWGALRSLISDIASTIGSKNGDMAQSDGCGKKRSISPPSCGMENPNKRFRAQPLVG